MAKLDKRLRELVLGADMEIGGQTPTGEFLVSSIYRPLVLELAKGRSGIHAFYRAIDIDTAGWRDRFKLNVLDWFNERIVYDPSRPKLRAAIFETKGGKNQSSGEHVHVQVHPRSVVLGNGAPK